jgi:hypothetical protein
MLDIDYFTRDQESNGMPISAALTLIKKAPGIKPKASLGSGLIPGL